MWLVGELHPPVETGGYKMFDVMGGVDLGAVKTSDFKLIGVDTAGLF